MNVLDLFSGIGGFSLGLERAGMRTVAFCECDPYCQHVLRKHWPNVPIYDDVRTLTAARLMADTESRWEKQPQGVNAKTFLSSGTGTSSRIVDGDIAPRIQHAGRTVADGSQIDVICGGFPCQDISVAGKGAGIGGTRSSLWSEYARIIGEVRPRYVIVENVAALLGRGLERVLGDLAAFGFDAEWHCIPASAVGAPHRRDRIWIVAHSIGFRCERRADEWRTPQGAGAHGLFAGSGDHAIDVAYAAANRWPEGREKSNGEDATPGRNGKGHIVRADTALADADRRPLFGTSIAWPERHPWLTEPDMGRVAHGVPARVDRLRSLGNAVVPQIPEIIGRAIMSIERNEYDGDDDFTRSIEEAYAVIRDRKAKGGKGWGGWE